MAWIVWLVSVGAIIFYLIRDSYVGELVSSFLPYAVGFWMFFALVALAVIIFSKKRWTRIVSGVSFVVLFLMSVWGGEKIYTFYGQNGWSRDNGWSDSFSILYSNIYVYNEEYDALEQTIEELDPDVLILVEFARHHWTALEDFLERQWFAHTNRINRETLYDSNLFASHSPIDQVINYGWLDDYINLESQELTIDGRQVMFHMVHLISPITPDYFLARNRQLKTLARLMQQATSGRPNHLHILIGDFNTSPWSSHYAQFQAALGDEWTNQTRQIPLLMTWKLPLAPWLRSHIDHVWTWGDATVMIQSLWLEGSDHRALKIVVGNK